MPRSNQRAIPGHFIFKIKSAPDGSTSFKARFVAGYKKITSEFSEKCAPLVNPQSFLTLLTYVLKKKYLVHHMDSAAVLLNVPLKEDIFME